MRIFSWLMVVLGIAGAVAGGVSVVPWFYHEEQEFVSPISWFLFLGGGSLVIIGVAHFLIYPLQPKRHRRLRARMKKQRQ